MKYLVDSDVVVDFLRGRSHATTLLAGMEPDGLAISLVTYGEVYEGILYGQNPPSATKGFRQFLRSVDVLSLNRRTMLRYAMLRGTLRQQGMLLNDPDLLIAATAINHDLILVTGNKRHFERISDLRIHP